MTFISPKAEFTPRNVQTAEERSKLVYRIKVSVDNRQGVLKQGMPVEADVPLARRPVVPWPTRRSSLERVTKRFGATSPSTTCRSRSAGARCSASSGPDGAGKTTTIRLLCGLLRADGGRIRVLGHDPVRQHAARHAATSGYFSQRFSLYGDLSIDENIAFFAEIHGLTRLRASGATGCST